MGTPYVILATGQSNIALKMPKTWTPNARAKVWNNDPGSDTSIGTAFVAIDSTLAGISECYASNVAVARPDLDVYLIKAARGAKDILYWVGGGFWNRGAAGYGNITLNASPELTTSITLSNVDVLGVRRPYAAAYLNVGEHIWLKSGAVSYKYQISAAHTWSTDSAIIPVTYISGTGSLDATVQVEFQPKFVKIMDDNIPPALAAVGASKIDMTLWWQGESDADYNSRYETEFEAAMTYMESKTWNSPSNKLIVCGLAPTAFNGLASSDVMNGRLAALAAAKPNRVFADIAGNVSISDWNDIYHMTGDGYYNAASYVASLSSPPVVIPDTSGTMKVRNAANTGWINVTTASVFKIRNADNTGWIDKTGGPSGVSIRNATNTGWITLSPITTSYAISPSITSVNEGSSVTYTITTTGIGSGTLYWSNSGTTTGSDFTDGQNNGSVTITGDSGTIVRTLSSDLTTEGLETIILNLRTGSIGGPIVKTASTVTVTDSSTGSAFPSDLTFTRNDLEFLYSEVKTSSVNTAYMEIIMTLDTTNFFNTMTRSDGHIVFAFDPVGDSSVYSGGTRDHCGQIVRHGQPLFDQARGFTLLRNGQIYSEHWFPGAGAGLTSLGYGFDPLVNKIFTVRLRAGYRSGTYGEKMEIDIFNGTSTSGSVLTGSTVSWGWDWSGSHRFLLGAIGYFVDPSSTGCIETTANGASYGATIGISNFSFNIIT
jgi:hypothetical protein